jgi:hypothetical protein
MVFVNLTPHALNIAGREIPPSGQVARVSATYAEIGTIEGIPIVTQKFGQVENLPDPAPDTVYIVSGLVRTALGTSRPDVAAPDTGPTAIRNGAGQIVGVTRLVGAQP